MDPAHESPSDTISAGSPSSGALPPEKPPCQLEPQCAEHAEQGQAADKVEAPYSGSPSQRDPMSTYYPVVTHDAHGSRSQVVYVWNKLCTDLMEAEGQQARHCCEAAATTLFRLLDSVGANMAQIGLFTASDTVVDSAKKMRFWSSTLRLLESVLHGQATNTDHILQGHLERVPGQILDANTPDFEGFAGPVLFVPLPAHADESTLNKEDYTRPLNIVSYSTMVDMQIAMKNVYQALHGTSGSQRPSVARAAELFPPEEYSYLNQLLLETRISMRNIDPDLLPQSHGIQESIMQFSQRVQQLSQQE